jgi:hypothetical protein
VSDPWVGRTPFDRMMDEIAAASSVREIDHLRAEVRRDFAGDARIPELEAVLDAKRRLLAADEGHNADTA